MGELAGVAGAVTRSQLKRFSSSTLGWVDQRGKGLIFIAIGTVMTGCGIATALAAQPQRSGTDSAGSRSWVMASTTTGLRVSSPTVSSPSTTTTYLVTSTLRAPTTTTSLISPSEGLTPGWYVRLGSSQPGVAREVSDMAALLQRLRPLYPGAAVYTTDSLQGRTSLRNGYLVLLIGSYPDRSSATTVCSTMDSSMKPYGCEVDQLR